MPIHLQKPRLVGFASNAAWQDLMQVADELLTDMKARAFDDDDDREQENNRVYPDTIIYCKVLSDSPNCTELIL